MFRAGPFSLRAGGTYTDAEITRDAINPAFEATDRDARPASSIRRRRNTTPTS